jgi:hypothetical protein
MKTTVIPTSDPNCAAVRCEAVLPHAATAFVISDNAPPSSNGARKLFRAIRAFLSNVTNSSAFQDISLNQRVEIIFTSNGPIVYRCEPSKNTRN